MTVPGSRAPTESLQNIRGSRCSRKSTIVFSAGNKAWLGILSEWVNHPDHGQNKEFSKSQTGAPSRTEACPGNCGTQALDKVWQSLKRLVGPRVYRKSGYGTEPKGSALVKELIQQLTNVSRISGRGQRSTVDLQATLLHVGPENQRCVAWCQDIERYNKCV